MARTPEIIDLPVTLHVSRQARDTLAQRATASGTDLAGYVSTLAELSASGTFSLEQLSGPVYQRFLESGTSDEQLSEELEKAKHELRAERRNRRAS